MIQDLYSFTHLCMHCFEQTELSAFFISLLNISNKLLCFSFKVVSFFLIKILIISDNVKVL